MGDLQLSILVYVEDIDLIGRIKKLAAAKVQEHQRNIEMEGTEIVQNVSVVEPE